MRTTLIFFCTLALFGQADSPTAMLRKSLKENFGMPGYATSWYKYIKDARVEGDAAVAQVNGQPAAVCSALSGFVYDRTQKLGLKRVKIVDMNGRVLIDRKTVAEPCR